MRIFEVSLIHYLVILIDVRGYIFCNGILVKIGTLVLIYHVTMGTTDTAYVLPLTNGVFKWYPIVIMPIMICRVAIR